MSLTLKKKYELEERVRLAEFKAHPEVLVEAIDDAQLKQMSKMLAQTSKLLSPYKLPELQKAIKTVSEKLSSAMSSRTVALAGMASDKLADWLTGTTSILSFEAGLIKGIRQLPDIVAVVDKMAPGPAAGEANEDNDLSLRQILSSEAVDTSDVNEPKGTPDEAQEASGKRPDQAERAVKSMKNMILAAFRPPGFLALFKGLPFVDDNRMAEEMLDLKWGEVKALSGEASKYDFQVPVDSDTARNVVKVARTARKNPAKAAEEIKQVITPASGEITTQEPAKAAVEPEEDDQHHVKVKLPKNIFYKRIAGTFGNLGTESRANHLANWLIKYGIELE